MRVHLEGLGWFGAVLARLLDERGDDWTWSDTNDLSAWPAAAGMIYPSGIDAAEWARHRWAAWLTGRAVPSFADVSWTAARWWWSQRHPPHQASFEGPIEQVGVWKTAFDAVALAVNPAEIVTDARDRWADRRELGQVWWSDVDSYLVAHGKLRTAPLIVWSWSRLVEPDWHPAFLAADPEGLPPALYSRRRVMATWLYPLPTVDGIRWLAGGTVITQREATPRDGESEWQRWLRLLVAEERGALRGVEPAGPIRQGWGGRTPQSSWNVTVSGSTLEVPTTWHSGVRWAPLVEYQTRKWLASVPVS